MKKRQLFRNRNKSQQRSVMNVKQKVTEYVEHARNGEGFIEIFGKFIMLSTRSGEAWLLDPRESLALRLADKSEPLPYTIIETAEKFSVGWAEKFRIKEDAFIAEGNLRKSIFMDYPIDRLRELSVILST